ncbi:glycosyltransferase family 2 protein [Azospirillum rugosum]|uniref:Glycosyltransferase involved in cell wall biosynthesis n=1 Tax=Azospirillum rugosum TaxID=416170 RepID=A0ABS4SPI7_9PROT|nr:glycosyltransferase [Azospirillum rugosum]MBP2294402.1 glycosyltransferase involved in cell wall biosynthesis [Azospirillum rugosum]MDQ0527737.1 glycosyltransferase involved in cell wall biosynthesis [Azospirillum rugosum]
MARKTIGSLDAVNINKGFGFVLSGWAIDIGNPDTKVGIGVVIDGQCVTTSWARYFNRDLFASGRGGGFNAFSVLVPLEHFSQDVRTVHVVGNGELIGSASIRLPEDGRPVGLAEAGAQPEDMPVDVIGDVAMLRGGGIFDAHWYEQVYPGVLDWCRETGSSPYHHYLLLGRPRNLLPHVPMNGTWYLERYGAIIRSMRGVDCRSLIDHYYNAGSIFGFDAVPGFDEQTYLHINDDVRASVEERLLVSGYRHYLMYGAAEQRQAPPGGALPPLPAHALLERPELVALFEGTGPLPGPTGRNWAEVNARRFPPQTPSDAFAEDLYRALRPDVSSAVSSRHIASACEHWVTYGVTEDMAGTAPRLTGYCEHRYLVNNPDVSAAVDRRAIPSGYHHFLSHGHREGRKGGLDLGEPPARTIASNDILKRIAERDRWPTISIVMPVYQTPERWLRATVESVLGQLYPFWELCIVDDASPSPHVRELLAEFAARDGRIRVASLPANGGISAASNAALSLAKGEWIALLDHDDQLTADALYEIAAAIVEQDPDVVYSDEDKMTVDGRFYDATCKPGWSPDLLRSTMYIGHLTCYRASVVRSVGGFRSECDGTQDYDLALRVAAVTERFVHVPKILYHWIAIPGSTAEVLSAKSYAIERQKTAIEGALAPGAATPFEVRPHWSTGNWRVVYAPPSPAPLVSVVIPSAGRMGEVFGMQVDILKNCVASLFGSECYENFEVVVVHNGELEASTLRFLRAFPNVRDVNAQRTSFNFSDRVNLGVEHARGDYVLLLNDDIQAISKHFLRDMVGLASQPGVGIVGPRLLFANGTIQHVGILLLNGSPTHALIGEHRLTPGPQGIGQLVHNAAAATAACMLVSRKLYQEVGGFDTGLWLNYNDVDFCNKVRARGLRIVIDPAIELYHFESLSKEGTFNWELQNFIRRWGIPADPYVNPAYAADSPFYEIDRSPAARPVRDVQEQIMARIAASRTRPPVEESIRFSFFMSTYKQPIRFLREIEKTILNQFYRNFEWVIVSDGDHRPELLDWLREVSAHENVTVIVAPENQGIMAGYGLAFRATSGDYVLPVDADDFLTLDALQVMAEHIHAHGRPAVLYSDEFKSNPESRLFSPFHKPEFDWVLHMNICFTCHLCALRRDVAVQIGAYTDLKATWSHDWDTFTRVERAGHAIVHVPHLLYAWRINPGSTASVESSMKPEALHSQRHVLEQHLALTGRDRALSVAENTLFPHPGIWRLAPEAGEPRRVAMVIAGGALRGEARAAAVAAVLTQRGRTAQSVRIQLAPGDGAAFQEALERLVVGYHALSGVTLHDAPLAVLLADAGAEADQVVFVQADCVPEQAGGVAELTGLLGGVDEAVAIGGRVLDTGDRVAWAGGFFGIGGFLATADYGREAGDSGYHGMLFCQRFVDGVSPSHWAARSGFLRDLLKTVGPDVSAAQIATAIALRAHADGKRVLYTPFSLWRLTERANVQPPPPSDALLASLGVEVPRESRWYSPRLYPVAAFSYQPRGYATGAVRAS